MAASFGIRGESRVCTFHQTSDLFHHSFFQTGVQAAVYAGVSLIAAHQGTDVIRILRQECRPVHRMPCFVYGNLQRTDQTFAGVVVGAVVQGFQTFQLSDELFGGFLFQFLSESRVCRDFREGISACCSFDVQS